MTYVGLVHPSRGTDHVVRALSELPESFHFAILGPRRPARDDALGELAASLGVGHRLHLLPPVPGEQVPATLATSDISIVPGLPVCLSYELAMANKLFESVMAGIPIAVSNGHRSMAEFVRDNQLGVVFDAGDASSIARAVQDAARELPAGLADPERLDTLRRRYSWERQEETLAQVYDVVAQSR
jgi:glycosyltransferase involved in cell wall biosynthesis